ncbi:hypothetical protein [Xanthomonas phage OP1]|uniref:Uncharacterized protein n=1 Tax=Xanthomonas phage OP1 TaxID=2994040 RepID=Q2NPF9_9CAUD|nr:hypothetical protein OP1_ORF32 [Xanthomonas phage OP1]BAE72737.1 hypothetical protein [Xanthomonas phage OP1]
MVSNPEGFFRFWPHNNLTNRERVLTMKMTQELDSYTLALLQDYTAAHGLHFDSMSEVDQFRWICKLLDEATEEEAFLATGGFVVNDDEFDI